jgi:hypothetical protein
MMKVFCLLLSICSTSGVINNGLCDVYEVNLYPYLSIQECGQVRACCRGIPGVDAYLIKKYFDKEAYINQIIKEIIQHRNEFTHHSALGSYNQLFEAFYQVTYGIICGLITVKYFSLPHTSPFILNYRLGQLYWTNPCFLSLSDLLKGGDNTIELINFDKLIADIDEFKQEVFTDRITGIVSQYLMDAENAKYLFHFMPNKANRN